MIDLLSADPAVLRLTGSLQARRRAVCAGSAGSSTTFIAAAVARLMRAPVVLVVAHLDDADEAEDELRSAGAPVLRLPALESLPGESGIAMDLVAERLRCVHEALLLNAPSAAPPPNTPNDIGQEPVIVCSIHALMQSVPTPGKLGAFSRVIRASERVSPADLARWLDGAGYRRVEAIEEPGDFSIRGGILDVFPPGTPTAAFSTRGPGTSEPTEAARGPAATVGPHDELVSGVPVRLDFFGDEIESIAEIDLETMASDRKLPAGVGVQLVCVELKALQSDEGSCNFLEILPSRCIAMIHETMEVVEQGRGYYERTSDSKGIFGPPAVLKLLQSRFAAIAEVSAFQATSIGGDVRVDMPVSRLPAFDRDLTRAIGEVVALTGEATRVLVACQTDGERHRCAELLSASDPASHVDSALQAKPADSPAQGHARKLQSIQVQQQYVHRGFGWRGDAPGVAFAVVPYHEILNRFTTRRRSARLRSARALDTFLDFQVGDYVVHQDHGVAIFSGLTTMKPRELPGAGAARSMGSSRADDVEEYLTLEFAGKSKLHVPALQIDKVQRYVGGFSGKPPLSTLGGTRWRSQKEKAADSVKDLAAEMLRVRVAREHMPGIAFPEDTNWQREFEDEFPYEETEDQLAALREIKRDMSSSKPMDRLICGDVGFGKTELAIRAAFKAAEFGKQVAVLVPTTVLAEQHERTFRDRFAGYPFRVESLSRFKSDKEAREIASAIRKGQADIVIGTHRILSNDVNFADLGLVIIDEEQRFGVEHKEALLRLRLTVDVLTLSATPIPRTLHMAMLGIRDISSLTTAPMDRRAIVTEVTPYNAKRIQQAIHRELAREGQIFFVHNRISDIKSVADDLHKLAPDARIVVGHGQMPPHELEEVMLDFIRGSKGRRRADILVSTTIIESGIDIPSANTIFINNAQNFGLADLHQLRGRVGRSKHRGYCYLLLPQDGTLREIATKRLKAIEQNAMLGAGFKIAMRDLEIRGAGNLLGAEQSGHIAAVGYEMYCRLMEQAVRDLTSEAPPVVPSNVSIEIGCAAIIPKAFIPSDARRLEAYRRLATAKSVEELDAFRKELVSAYGEPPRAAARLLELAELRLALIALDVRTLTIRDKDVIFFTPRPREVAEKLSKNLRQGTVRVIENAGASQAGPNTSARPGEAASAAGPGRGVPGVSSPREATSKLHEVYFRPPEIYLDPDTLLLILRSKLAGRGGESPLDRDESSQGALPAPVAGGQRSTRGRRSARR
ncbi:MAG: transcription-repair coupling factor [Planctomycetota bacterium]|nr:transcription-repair coupling factor [Planctomycetota bacterium]